MDQRIRKLMTMLRAFFPRDDVDRLYVSRKEGEKGFISTENSVEVSIQRLEGWVEKRGERLITATRNNTDTPRTNKPTIIRKQKCEEKQLYGRFKQLISNISHEKMWTWLRKGNLERETESFQIAARNNAIRTNHIKTRIDKTQQNSKCRLCGNRNKIINHIISECSKLVMQEYKTKHDWVGKVIHWDLCKKFKFDHTNKWYMPSPASVMENETHKLQWDFDLFT